MTKEIGQILEAYARIDFNAQKAALATVVHVQGSSYRRPGARMLITDDGNLTGAISGGCLEGDALRKARLVMHLGKAVVITYDTTDEDDAKIGIGLGCNGIIHILIEPVYPGKINNPIDLLSRACVNRQRYVLATLFSLTDKSYNPPGTCCLYSEHAQHFNSISDTILRQDIEADVAAVFKTSRSIIKEYQQSQGTLSAFIELVEPVISLIILGAGNDVIPLTEIAHVLGWEATVIDGRLSHAKPERFPSAKQVILAKPEEVLSIVKPDKRTFFVLMTHNYNYDVAAFRILIQCNARYIGVLGPRKKLNRMIEEINDKLMLPDWSSVYGPVGLDIGAEAPEEIALSIIAEIKAVSEGREGGSLRKKNEAIHNNADQFSSLFK